MSSSKPSPNQDQMKSPVKSAEVRRPSSCIPSALTDEEAEALMEEIVPTPVSSRAGPSASEEEQAKADSPLNDAVPNISIDKIRPLVVSCWDRAAGLDLSDQESRRLLAEMFVEVIVTYCNLILEAFNNFVLAGRQGECPLLVSEEAVERAVHPSLCESLRAALGSTHQAITKLDKLVKSEVTSMVNSALCCSQVQNERLVVPQDTDYKPPKEKIRAMVRHARAMLRSFRDKVSCGGCVAPEEPTPQAQEKEEAPTRRIQNIKDQLGRSCRPCSRRVHSEETQEVTSSKEVSSTPKVDSTKSPTLDYLPHRIPDKLDRCRVPSRGGSEEQQSSTDGAESEEEQHSTRLCSFKSKLCSLSCVPCGSQVHSEEVSSRAPVHLLSRDQEFTKPASPSTSLRAEEVQDILEEAVAVSQDILKECHGLPQRSLRTEIQDTASTIVSILNNKSLIQAVSGGLPIVAEHGGICDTRMPRLTAVAQKIKSFFVLCYAENTFCTSLRKLCCRPISSDISPEVVMEQAFPLLKTLVREEASEDPERDVYQRLSQEIRDGEYRELSEQLTEVISHNMALTKGHKEFRREVRFEMKTFIGSIWSWLQIQQQRPALQDPVQRALGTIKRLIFRTSSPPQDTQQPMITCTEDPLYYISPEFCKQKQHLQSPGHVQDVSKINLWRIPTSMPQDRLREQPNQWNMDHYTDLVSEVVNKVFQKQQGPEMTALARDLLQQLEPQIAQWDVKVKPDIQHFEDVAQAVYRDLCRGKKKIYVTLRAQVRPGFSAEVVETIYKHLTAPEKKRRTLGSFLRSVRRAFCWGR